MNPVLHLLLLPCPRVGAESPVVKKRPTEYLRRNRNFFDVAYFIVDSLKKIQKTRRIVITMIALLTAGIVIVARLEAKLCRGVGLLTTRG
jgi:hypothetical protein